jgi:hypothetical protein
MRNEKAGGPVPWTLDEFARRGRAAQKAVDELGAGAPMPLLPNAFHPGGRCSCRDCVIAFPRWPL